jgi:hypothetical protein
MRDSSATDAKDIDGPVELPAGAEDDYAHAMRDAMARMDKGFPTGEIPKLDREALHDRAPLWPRESR